MLTAQVKMPGIVVSRNKKKKTAFIKFFMEDGIEKTKQLVLLKDIFYMCSSSQTEVLINGNESLRAKFMYAKTMKENLEEEIQEDEYNWLEWY